jgi:hypothetical protein
MTAKDEDEHARRAREVEDRIRQADKKRDDGGGEVDLAKERLPGSNEGSPLDKILSTLDACAKAMDSMSSRLDALEATRKKDDESKKSDDDDDGDMEKGKNPGEAREVDAGATRRHALADAQTRIDAVALRFGQRSDGPLHGESVRAYRTRQLRRYQKYSPMYKVADLDSIADEAVFTGVEEKIFADAIAAADSPDSIPVGTLRIRSRTTDSGHRINEFFGAPQAWMDRFAGNRRYVTRINPKGGSSE